MSVVLNDRENMPGDISDVVLKPFKMNGYMLLLFANSESGNIVLSKGFTKLFVEGLINTLGPAIF
ncbi:hypothetical protein CCS41_01735 [Candidatus Fukatsuia symbiotica]|uniref:Uncharacterized protein n=1 Tax=Candidatus Fukatsuia symbiotica TaxID=1878942 RepID=A0A2U8I329_9GAMM|nr:hypothetical protein CCS41_01735 [Candidatus Fukatsuia symbiotica]